MTLIYCVGVLIVLAILTHSQYWVKNKYSENVGLLLMAILWPVAALAILMEFVHELYLAWRD